MSDAIAIFVLIGVAHWASHILQCRECKGAVLATTVMGLEGAVKVFGWPIHMVEYAYDMLKKKPDPEPIQPQVFGPFIIPKVEGESEAEAAARFTKAVQEEMAKIGIEPEDLKGRTE